MSEATIDWGVVLLQPTPQPTTIPVISPPSDRLLITRKFAALLSQSQPISFRQETNYRLPGRAQGCLIWRWLPKEKMLKDNINNLSSPYQKTRPQGVQRTINSRPLSCRRAVGFFALKKSWWELKQIIYCQCGRVDAAINAVSEPSEWLMVGFNYQRR